MQCQEWNIAHIALDVTIKHRLTSIKAKLDNIRKAFKLEILVSPSIQHAKNINAHTGPMALKGASSEAADALRSLATEINDMRDAREEDEKDRKAMLEKLRQLQDDVSESRRNILSLKPLLNTTLNIVSVPNPSILVKLYQDMTEIAQIQTLYSIVEIDGSLYAAIEDMAQHISFADALETGFIAKLSRLQKLQIRHKIAATLLALYRAEIILNKGKAFQIAKCLKSKRSISKSGHIWFPHPADLRFEALETEKLALPYLDMA
ncbi:uncharacterized protein BDR25DRAFT_358516 [Lindgomyces ingoldianus]|uniref:Uncharacterized protein n=1 Tax=Lindgomyces ingoldianus TaxID=673940 RepID=A0ACB6QK54_9PLEO|nr:uncharacterized protein BDR25DRAFT_358516 [Lindgomyces ingoldianus]KAF2467399.1 hypothetical protein BDR25DRAFT_358516 [Lindgomyces ingoldianus]